MTSASQTDPLLGRLIDGRYQVRSRIARGGMATVYLATDLRLERRVAIKVMHSHLAEDTSFKLRFVQEARSSARLAHPNVVNVFDQGQDEDMAYLVMEYLPGITLRDLLRDYGKLTPEQTMDIMESVISGLAAAHRAGIVHRDLKPENVLLADDGRIKIGDFGLARAVSKATGTGQALLGTIAYLSPELVTRGVADTRSDIYAIGIMMYEMLTGEQPFQGEQPMQIAYQHANDSVPRPSRKNPLVPPQLDELVLWATARDPEDRPRDAAALLDGLLEVERTVRGGTPAAAPSGLDPTMVLDPIEAAATTRIIAPLNPTTVLAGPATQVRAEATVTDAVGRLARVSRHRRARGWWLFVLVLVVAALAGGTGWYYGAGPGALVTVPMVENDTVTAALHSLDHRHLHARQTQVYSTTVKAGAVVGTTPGSGSSVHRGSTVTLRVSKGARATTIHALAGLTLADARTALRAAHLLVGAKVDYQFSAAVATDEVISATRASDGKDFSNGGSALQGQIIDLAVSLGAVPDLKGMTIAEAEQSLHNVGLKSGEGSKAFNDSVAKGHVIKGEPENTTGPVRKGDTILIDVSRGPELFPVPDVTGDTLDNAVAALKQDGFKASYDSWLNLVPDVVTKVTAQSPAGQSQQPKGTTIALTVSAAG